MVVLGLALISTGCPLLEWLAGITHQRLEDPRVKPYLEAARRSRRSDLGFTQLPEAGSVRVEVPRWKTHYDVMLHIDRGNVTRTVDFLVRGGQPVWSGEQEIHYGPREYTTVDGTHRESLVISYSTVQGSGNPVGWGFYSGPDAELTMRSFRKLLSVEDARRIWETWPE
jgi:hypothetical protein